MLESNIIKGLIKLLEKRSEIKLSYYKNVFYVSVSINSETIEDYEYLESLGWEEVEYQWLYKEIRQ